MADVRGSILLAGLLLGTIHGSAWALCGEQGNPENPDIKANGSDGPLTIQQNYSLMLTISVSPGVYTGKPADWWIVTHTAGEWFTYDLVTGQWSHGLRPSYQGPMYRIASKVIYFGSGLPPGDYTCYFGFDCIQNGVPDLDLLVMNEVSFTIRP